LIRETAKVHQELYSHGGRGGGGVWWDASNGMVFTECREIRQKLLQ